MNVKTEKQENGAPLSKSALRRQREREQRLATILGAAQTLFARDGYHATSLRGITTAAGVNLAAVNYHFGSKEALLEAVIVRRLTPLNEIRRGRLETLLQEAASAGERPLSSMPPCSR